MDARAGTDGLEPERAGVLLGDGIDWTNVLVALIAGLPAIIAAIFAGRVHRQVRTPSGDAIGHVVERAHEVGVANNMLLRMGDGATQPATRENLSDALHSPPEVPSTDPPG